MKDKKITKKEKQDVKESNNNNKDNNLMNLKEKTKIALNKVLAGNKETKNCLEFYSHILKRNLRHHSYNKSSSGCLSGHLNNTNYNSSGSSNNQNALYSTKQSFHLKIYTAMQKSIAKKNYTSKADHDMMVLENLIYNRNCHIVSVFKEYMILDFIDEFLKRSYRLFESTERIPKFANYYKNYLKFFCNPVFRDLKVNGIVQIYGDNKAELYYNRNYGIKKKKEKKSRINFDDNLRIIFNNTIKDNIDKNSMTQTQSSIRKDLIDNNDSIEVFRPVDFRSHHKEIENNCAKRCVKEDINNSTNLAIGDENFNCSFVNQSGMMSKRSKEESIINILSHLDNGPLDVFGKRHKLTNKISGKYMFNSISTEKISNNKKSALKLNDEKVIKEFEQKVIPNIISPTNFNRKTFSISQNNPRMNSNGDNNIINIQNRQQSGHIIQNEFQTMDKSTIVSSNNTKLKNNANYKLVYNDNNNDNYINANCLDIKSHKSQKSPLKFSPKNALYKSSEYKNLKTTKPNNFNSNENNRQLLGLNSGQTNHVKNVYSTEFNTFGSTISNINSDNAHFHNMPKNGPKFGEKEKMTINSSNSNTVTNTPLLNSSSKTVNKFTSDHLKLKKIKPENILSHKKESSSNVKISMKNNENNNYNLKRLSNNNLLQTQGSSNNSNNNKMNSNGLGNSNNLNNASGTINSINSINDIMKITLSLYMDKTSRNRPTSNIGLASTNNLIQSQHIPSVNNFLDSGRKTTIINKVDNINNFNININNGSNFNDQIQKLLHSGIANNANVNINNNINNNLNNLNSGNVNNNITSVKKDDLHGEKSQNNTVNLKQIIENNKNLSRNKNSSLYKIPSILAKSSHYEEEEDNLRGSMSNTLQKSINKHDNLKGAVDMKIFSSHGNTIDPKGTLYHAKIYDNILNFGIKKTIDDYPNYHFKKHEQLKNLSESKSPFKYQTELSSRNSTFNNKKIFNSNVNMMNNEKKIQKIKLGSNSDLKKLITVSTSNLAGTISKLKSVSNSNNMSVNPNKGSKMIGMYASTNNINNNKYLSVIKK